jgi:hypothetical protein
MLRVPPELTAALRQLARREHRSRNSQAVHLLEHAIQQGAHHGNTTRREDSHVAKNEGNRE